jgi:hypothetical protein
MNLITKYKLFENNELSNKSIGDLTKNDLSDLVNNYLLTDDFFNFFKSNDINLSKETNITLSKGKNSFDLLINFDEPRYTYYSTFFKIISSKFTNMDVGEITLYLKIVYNNYILYEKSLEIDFIKKNDNIYNNIKDFFINSNKEIISTPFVGTKKEVDDAEKFMMLLASIKKYPVFYYKDALEKIKEINNNPNYGYDLPKDLKFIENIKFIKHYYRDKDNTIFFYAKFDHGDELIQIHEQYAHKVYKMYKKIVDN